MIVIEDKIISYDVLDKEFVCNLSACKGACCIEGDSGAPLEEKELQILQDEYVNFERHLTKEGKEAIKNQGLSVWDEEDQKHKTPLIDGKACAFINWENGMSVCGIEKAHQLGKTSFRKPVSCHLYPIRIETYEEFEAVNYEKWDICSAACKLGEKLKVPVYQFAKDALIRKYGADFYQALDDLAKLKKEK